MYKCKSFGQTFLKGLRFLKAEPLAAFRRKRNSFAGYTQEGVKKQSGGLFESVEKVDTLLDGNAVRSKIKDFRTALYPRQYHLSVLEKPLIKRLFAYKVFFRRTCRRKNKIRLTAAEKLNLRFIDRLRPDTIKRYQVFFAAFL